MSYCTSDVYNKTAHPARISEKATVHMHGIGQLDPNLACRAPSRDARPRSTPPSSRLAAQCPRFATATAHTARAVNRPKCRSHEASQRAWTRQRPASVEVRSMTHGLWQCSDQKELRGVAAHTPTTSPHIPPLYSALATQQLAHRHRAQYLLLKRAH